MNFHPTAVGCHYAGQFLHLLLCPRTCIGITVKMQRLNYHPPLRHHPRCHRGINTARQQNQTFPVSAQRKSSEALDFFIVEICPISAEINEQLAVRLMDVHLQHFTADQNACADNPGNLRRLDRKRLVRPFRLYLEGSNSSLPDLLLHEFHRRFADSVQITGSFHRRAYGGHAEHSGHLTDDFL